jgi:glycine/D-amino acid oxidase-like deaminating enzyme
MVEEPSTGLQSGDAQPKAAAAIDDSYGKTWFTATGESAPARPALTHDIDVDVCIIGGGLAGLTTALEVARRGWSVAVLEARRLTWNASSRNTGFVRPGFDQRPVTLVERVGTDHARELWLLSQDGVDYMRRTAADIGGRDLVQGEGWLQVSKIDRARDMSDEAERLRSLGADVELWPAHLVREKIKSQHYFQAIHFPTAFNIHPYDYALGVARLAEQAGARLFEATPAAAIDPAGVRKRVITPQGRVRASQIVFAGNVHLGAMLPEAADTLIALHTFAMVTTPLGDSLSAAIDYPGAVSDSESSGHHYRIVGGDRLMFAGRLATRPSNPDRHARWLRADLRRRFPQLGQVDIDHAWGGAIGVTVHGMPQIGEVAPGVWLASGFGGHGLNTSAMAATLITGAIIDGDDRFRLFEPFELIWSGGRMGRAVAKYFYAAHRRYEEWASRRSRRHELWWIKNEPRLKKEAEEAAERARIRAEEAAVAEAARIEREKLEAEQAEIRRIERERIAAEKAEAKRVRAEEKAAAKAEAARVKDEQRAAARAEKERIAAEKAEAKRLEAERLAAERAEAERIEAERRAAEQADAERLDAAYRNAERVAENAARLIAEGSAARPAPGEGNNTPRAEAEASPPSAGAPEPEKAQPDASDEQGPKPRGGSRRN